MFGERKPYPGPTNGPRGLLFWFLIAVIAAALFVVAAFLLVVFAMAGVA